jgi:hypothetical protein
MFDELSARSPISTVGRIAPRILRVNAVTHGLYLSSNRLFRPFTLGIAALAIAIALWGIGYKLCLHPRHSSSSSQIPVAKLWIESRDDLRATASRLRVAAHFVPSSHAFSVPVQRLPRFSWTAACTLSRCMRNLVYFDSLFPLRSPPPHRFRLA